MPSSAPASPCQDRLPEEAFVEAVDRRMSALLADYRRSAEEISTSAAPLVEAIAGLVRGGKRVRAILAWWGWRGAGGAVDDQRIIDAAVGLELFQAAALIHDDILDRSDTRRGEPSIHRAFAARHQQAGWRQDPEHFGTSAAILTGDLCLALSEEVFAHAADATESPAAGRTMFNRMRFEVMAGQYLDVLDEVEVPGQDPAEALARARTVLRYKSARYSVVHPLNLGGVLADTDGAPLTYYEAFSLPLGEAFQLQDDLLGVFGDPEVTGKPAGDDLREGKRTELVAHALSLLPPGQAKILENSLGDPDLTPESVARLQSLLTECGARARVEDEVATLGDQALRALDEMTVDHAVRDGLARLAHRILRHGR
ncbi:MULTISPECIES: polyprenyl synthetase family protein [Micrococcaceae]|uniref:polyprenyl synthetase family protein n=2 Tax=Micrococcales TaxID=85006 RepID=UPI0018128FFB|nr:polyprenyl synthetase family protein [Citricoccus sp.]MBB5749200.1 geranylgeranyl diphosphate synthase type I [Micrococcus sp. TA1]HRO29399.1 polyprenyl synthetase family protein [Citricoccus sp.]HRO93018.1 polyprenyl synthetase family protein [Citricoccus sp.]